MRTYLDPKTKSFKMLGCWCVMSVKATLIVNCWLWERTGDGWPNRLNSDYVEPTS
jgi:hypothetical protein